MRKTRAILAALLQTQRTGQGQHVDVAMFDTTLSFLATAMARYLFTGKPARSCVEVARLPKDVLCEIEAIAEP